MAGFQEIIGPSGKVSHRWRERANDIGRCAMVAHGGGAGIAKAFQDGIHGTVLRQTIIGKIVQLFLIAI